MFWGWWGWSPRGGGRGGGGYWLLPTVIFFGLVWLFGERLHMGWMAWVIASIVAFTVVPSVLRSINRNAQAGAELEKQKRDDFDYEADEKPKREPRYVLGDDGELIEVDEVDGDDEKSKRFDTL